MRPKLIKERKGILNTLHAWMITDNYGKELATVHAKRFSSGLWQVDVYNASEWTGTGNGRTIVASLEAIDPLTANERSLDNIGAKKFHEYCQSEKHLLEIARAHSCGDEYGVHQYYKALVWPHEERVSPKQIEAAKAQAARLKESRLEVMRITPARLIFCGYGMERPDGMNYRIRCEIVAADGQEYFLELCHNEARKNKRGKIEKEECWNVTHFINHVELNKRGEEVDRGGRGTYIPYSEKAVTDWVNENLGCNFFSMGVDQYLLRTEDYKNVSPSLSE